MKILKHWNLLLNQAHTGPWPAHAPGFLRLFLCLRMCVCTCVCACVCTRVVQNCVVFTDPPAITAIGVTEVCTNDFTVSWTAASNEEGLSYSVTLSSPSVMNDIVVDVVMNTSYNFTGLLPDTTYNVSVASRIISTTCVGIANTTMVTTLTVKSGVPQSELIFVNMYIHLKCLYFIYCVS